MMKKNDASGNKKMERNKAERNEAALCKEAAKTKNFKQKEKKPWKTGRKQKEQKDVKRQNKVQTQTHVRKRGVKRIFCSDLLWLFVIQGHTTTNTLFL